MWSLLAHLTPSYLEWMVRGGGCWHVCGFNLHQCRISLDRFNMISQGKSVKTYPGHCTYRCSNLLWYYIPSPPSGYNPGGVETMDVWSAILKVVRQDVDAMRIAHSRAGKMLDQWGGGWVFKKYCTAKRVDLGFFFVSYIFQFYSPLNQSTIKSSTLPFIPIIRLTPQTQQREGGNWRRHARSSAAAFWLQGIMFFVFIILCLIASFLCFSSYVWQSCKTNDWVN